MVPKTVIQRFVWHYICKEQKCFFKIFQTFQTVCKVVLSASGILEMLSGYFALVSSASKLLFPRFFEV
jgi:hypothetical protein